MNNCLFCKIQRDQEFYHTILIATLLKKNICREIKVTKLSTNWYELLFTFLLGILVRKCVQ